MTTRGTAVQQSSNERAALINLLTRASRGADPDLALDELAGLAEAAGAVVVLRASQERPTPEPATLIGRGKAEEIARAVAFLVDDNAGFITGSTLSVNGGQHMY